MDNRVRVEPEDVAAVERLARCIMRPPISLERMEWNEVGEVCYRRKRGHESAGLGEREVEAFDAGGCHVIVLDSVSVVGGELKYEGRVDRRQLAWLRRHLEGVDSSTPVILLTHIPLLTAFYQATEGATSAAPANRVMVNNIEVPELLAHHNLVLVLQGHLHVDEMLCWRDTTFITGGAVCGKWWRGSWNGTREGFGVVTLRPDRIDWEYRSYGWNARRP